MAHKKTCFRPITARPCLQTGHGRQLSETGKWQSQCSAVSSLCIERVRFSAATLRMYKQWNLLRVLENTIDDSL